MKNNKTTLTLMGIAILLFVTVKIIPMFKSDIVHTTGSIELKKKKVEFTNKGKAWMVSNIGDTITQIKLEIAKNDYEIEKGLMDRKSLNESNGVLFVFNEEKERTFWMKNTSIPLDIIYLNHNGNIVSIASSTVPYSTEPIPSNGRACYVLEVNAGFVERNRIMLDSKLIFEKKY